MPWEGPVPILGERSGRLFEGIHDCRRALNVGARDDFRIPGSDHVVGQQEIGLAGGNALSAQASRIVRDANVRHHRTVLLGHAGHVEHTDCLAFKVRGHPEERADRNDTAAANPRDEDIEGSVQGRFLRVKEIRLEGRRQRGSRRRRLQLHSDEAWAETFDTGQIPIAGVLVYCALASQSRFQGHDCRAIRDPTAIAAALADFRIDEYAPGRLRELPLFASAPLLGSAGLVVDQNTDARKLPEGFLHRIELGTRMDRRALADGGIGAMRPRILGHNGNSLHTFCCDLAHDGADRQRSVDRLTTGHGDRIVEQNFIGDVDPSGDGGAYRQAARMVVGAITEIREHVL